MKNCAEKKTYCYREIDGESLYLDIYYPQIKREDGVTILTLPSGAFWNGARDDELQIKIIKSLVAKGFTVVSIDYRQGMRDKEQVKHYALRLGFDRVYSYCVKIAIDDLFTAVDYLRTKAYFLKIDTTKIVLMGSSAGAIVALTSEYNRVNPYFSLDYAPRNWRPMAIVACAGATLCRTRIFRYANEPAPTLMIHGTEDRLVKSGRTRFIVGNGGFYGSRLVKDEIVAAGGKCQMIWIRGAEHEASLALPKLTDDISKFIDDVLAYKTESSEKFVQMHFEEAEEWRGQNFITLFYKILYDNSNEAPFL